MPVESSRHYRGAGLGEATWRCPACGGENTGPLERGCALCGSGAPGRRVEPPPPPPRLPAPEVRQGDVADHWAAANHGVTIAEAYRAGYFEGVRTTLEAQQKALREGPPAVETFSEEGKIGRTIAAALALFRDQVLSGHPEEVTSGEWCSAAEVDKLIEQLRHNLEEPAHA